MDFRSSATRDQTLSAYTANARAIRQAAGECLKRVPLERKLRLLGVRVGSLAHGDGAQEAVARSAAAGSRNEIEPELF